MTSNFNTEIQWNYLDVCESTQDELKNELKKSSAVGIGFWTLNQTKGHGRQGRHWVSPKGNLAFSFAVDWKTESATWIPLYCAHALQKCLNDRGIRVSLKWPNDLFMDGKKCAGILVDRSDTKTLIGIGINSEAGPKDLDQATTDVSLFSEKVDVNQISEFLNHFVKALAGISKFDHKEISDQVRPKVGEVFSIQGNEPVQAKSLGLGASGELLCEVSGQKRSLWNESIRFI